MKMVLGSGTISNYGSYTNNCVKNQYPYKIPVNNLQDVQLYIDIGGIKPSAIQYQLIHTCGSFGGTIETLTTSSYVVGQNIDNYWYGVFKNFNNAANPLTCFVIAITLTINETDQIYFSDEYCIESCRPLTEIKGCYGNLDSNISTNCQGIYFGIHAGEDTALGDTTIVYEHKMLLRDSEVYVSAIKNTFKQGRTRNFRTEKEKIFQFNGEWVPAWYLDEVDAVFYRGEIYFDGTHYLVNETAYELIDDCKKTWKIPATLKESCYQSFSCETDPCAAPVETCCDPEGIEATIEFEDSGSGDSVESCCGPEVISADVSNDSGDEETFYIIDFDDTPLIDSNTDHLIWWPLGTP